MKTFTICMAFFGLVQGGQYSLHYSPIPLATSYSSSILGPAALVGSHSSGLLLPSVYSAAVASPSYDDGSYDDGSYGDGSYSDGSYGDGSNGDGSYSDGSYSDGSYSDGSYSNVIAVAPVKAAPAALVAHPSVVSHHSGNIGPTAGAATIKGPSGVVHSPAVTAGLH